ncbi:MAG: hypothetical protein Q4D54_07805 [Eubacteriales bacterium]|nr:hypothetical protein [Lachnospiraceae bacterium]MDO5127638.1 hypothetical protein [Eubacteriales bacterium]
MTDYFAMLTVATGDDSKPIFVAICLIVSIVLLAVLLIVGKKSSFQSEDTPEDEVDDDSQDMEE